MATRKTPLLPGEIYHIYNRGNGKNTIFFDSRDYARFMALLYLANGTDPVVMERMLDKGKSIEKIYSADRGTQLVDIGAYCLMPNHFHILLRGKEDGGISKFMLKLATGYAMYLNKKYGRTGGLFEGAFKSKHVDKEGYFGWLFAYIHLNPVKLIDPDWKEEGIADFSEALEFMKGFPYSSYRDYFGGGEEKGKTGKRGEKGQKMGAKARPEQAILNPDMLPDHLKKIDDAAGIIAEFNANLFSGGVIHRQG